MYRSPVEILTKDIETRIAKELDKEIYKAVVSVGINVDKAELLRALQYDRGQYQKGYFDGVEAATPRWIPAVELLPGDEQDRVLVQIDCDCLFGNQKIDTDRYCDGRWVRYGDHVTHWMSLPASQKEE